MNLTFVELPPFIRFRDEHLNDDEYRAIQTELLENPEKGDVIQGLGGLRKIRIAQGKSNKGKQGGARAIYFYYVSKDRIYFVTAYGKNKQADLTNEQRKVLSSIVELIKAENS
ncbi:toxin [Pasteurellaceae bacterium Orientalotternb1]|nr:toxin [Pasteurellaceae bacterium Orientalotternb1]